MKITVTITKVLEDWWGPEDMATLPDSEVVEMLRDDLYDLVENAEWKITKEPRPSPPMGEKGKEAGDV